MNPPLGHDQAWAALAAEALDALPEAERAGVLAHAAGCEECARELASLRAAAGALDRAVPAPPLDPERSARIRARLLARAAADAGGQRVPPAPPAPPAPSSLLGRVGRSPAAGWLVAAGLASLLLTHHSFHQPLSFGWLVASTLSAGLLGLGLLALRQRRRVDALEREVERLRPGP